MALVNERTNHQLTVFQQVFTDTNVHTHNVYKTLNILWGGDIIWKTLVLLSGTVFHSIFPSGYELWGCIISIIWKTPISNFAQHWAETWLHNCRYCTSQGIHETVCGRERAQSERQGSYSEGRISQVEWAISVLYFDDAINTILWPYVNSDSHANIYNAIKQIGSCWKRGWNSKIPRSLSTSLFLSQYCCMT